MATLTESAFPDALPPHYRLHWYVLERVLGQGGFGITYLARDTNLDQQVAIKEYLPVDVATRRADSTVRPRSEDQTERYRWGLERFILEARTLAKFDHPNIVRVLSVFEHNGTAYMVMRFEEGENFGALLDRKRTLGEQELMRVLLPVLDGLKLVHEAGFIHRDIKPDNIHIRADGSPVLLDFGSARHSMGNARTVTILVAPGYAPFEQYYSSGEDQGPWTDIYSLGATCYRAIAGVAPMDAIARSKGILGSTRELLVPASAIGAGRYSERFLKAVDHALAFAEKDRPGTIDLWRKELVGEKAITSATPGPAAPTGGHPAPAPTLALNPSRPAATRAALLIALVTAVAIIGGAIGAYLVTREPRQPTDPLNPSRPIVAQAPEDMTPKAAEQESKEKEARAEAERLAKAEHDRQEAQKRAEDEARKRQQELEAKLKQAQEAAKRAEAEAARRAAAVRARAAAEQAQKKAPEPKSSEPQIASVSPPQPPAPKCPEQGDVAIYNCYRALAGKGDAIAALKVGELYEAGRGVRKSNNSAYFWFVVSELRGEPSAKAKKDAISARLQPIEIEQMDKLARSEVRSQK
jgi:serine/threonine protein kinase